MSCAPFVATANGVFGLVGFSFFVSGAVFFFLGRWTKPRRAFDPRMSDRETGIGA